jgi:hypothetical protein
MSRAPSWIDLRIFRAGAFGQQRGFKSQASQSSAYRMPLPLVDENGLMRYRASKR